jgi:hypothetical protein
MIRQLARATVSATMRDDLADRSTAPIAEFVLTMTMLGFIGLIIVGIVVIVVAIADGSR